MAKSPVQQNFYTVVFFVFVVLVVLRRAVWCCCQKGCCCQKVCCCKKGTDFELCLTKGHGTLTSTNFVSCVILYPAVFMACHHLLWIFLGIITEPFWGITVLVAVVSVSAALYFLVCEFHRSFPSFKRKRKKKKNLQDQVTSFVPGDEKRRDPENEVHASVYFMSLGLVLLGFGAFVLLMIVLLVVAQSFLSEKLISAIVQNVLVLVATVWFGYLKHHRGQEEERERRREEGTQTEQARTGMQGVHTSPV